MSSGGATNPTAVLDTNLLVSGTITPHGIPNQILRAWQAGRFTLASSPELVAEASDVFRRPFIQQYEHVDQAAITRLLTDLADHASSSLSPEQLPIHSRDVEDDPVLACALASGADYIVTGDEDLLVLDGDPALGSLRIVPAREFLSILG